MGVIQASSPKSVALGVRAPPDEFEGDTIQTTVVGIRAPLSSNPPNASFLSSIYLTSFLFLLKKRMPTFC